MSASQWESLCDGCGKCCVIRLEDEDSGAVVATDLHCRLFNPRTCRCLDYGNRAARVPGCVQLRPDNIEALQWMPRTCAYRLISEGKGLPNWHHLVSGSRRTIHDQGRSVFGLTVSEQSVPEAEWEDHVTVLPGEEA
jgi:uncharacterized protein